MKHSKIFTALAALFLISATAHAQVTLLKKHNVSFLDSKDTTQPTLVTFRIVTDHRYSAIYYVQNFKGTSTTAPCSDLTLASTYYSAKSEVVPANEAVISYDLLYEYGPAVTCVKTDMMLNNTTFSTGNIMLLWDENIKVYTAAEPNAVVIDLSKGDVEA